MFKEVRLHAREAMGNKRVGGLLLRQAIHSSSKHLQKGRAQIGEWKSEDEENECGEERDDLQACIVVLYIMYCTAL